MPDCAACPLYSIETELTSCLHVNRPGGLELTARAIQLAEIPAGANILEVASGAGATLNLIKNEYGLNPVGLDASAAMLRRGKTEYVDIPVLQASAVRLPFANESWQVVMMECALSLASDFRAALKEFHRVLTPGGILIVTDIYIRVVHDQDALKYLKTAGCLSGALPEREIFQGASMSGFGTYHWQDETGYFKQWMAGMVFRLGSLKAFYRQMVSSDREAEALNAAIGKKMKLGYYLMVARKSGHDF